MPAKAGAPYSICLFAGCDLWLGMDFGHLMLLDENIYGTGQKITKLQIWSALGPCRERGGRGGGGVIIERQRFLVRGNVNFVESLTASAF